MLTPEQIKRLKPGDIIYLNNYPLTFNTSSIDAKIINAYDNVSDNGEGDLCWFSSEYLTMQSPPKHDPCRLFKKGDIVRLKEWNGRCPALPEDWKFDNGLFKVHEDEKFNSSVEITRENSKTVYIAPICFLELVTPVEELEPYKLIDSPNTYNIVRDSAMVMTIHKKSHPNAKAAAEAERDRLNAEYRKEQK